MGKNNKKRKRTNHALFHAVKARMQSEEATAAAGTVKAVESTTIFTARNKVETSTLGDDSPTTTTGITDNDLTTTITTLEKLVTNPTLFHSKRFKDLRRTLHPLILEQMKSYDKGIDYRQRVTQALANKNWSDALAALQACVDFSQYPKQGTVQRWVRDCMQAGNCQMQLLQAILKVSANNGEVGDGNKHDPAQAWAEQLAANTEAKDGITILPGWKWWENNNNNNNSNENSGTANDDNKDMAEEKKEAVKKDDNNEENKKKEATESDSKKQKKSEEKKNDKKEGDGKEENSETKDDNKPTTQNLESRILYREAAAERTPPNHYDLLLHTTKPGSGIIKWASSPPTTTAAYPIPFLPQPARVLANVLTPSECQQLRQVMTTLGYRPDHPVALDKPTGIDSCEWMVNDEIANKILERVRPHLPATLTSPQNNGGRNVQLHSINSRWRGFRYGQDCVYRPHLDGSWPYSYITIASQDDNDDDDLYSTGTYCCPKQSAIKSYLTFLLYLNDDFDGGETRFYLPAGIARGIVPKMGSVVVFPQGNLASLIHEGSQVTRGVKYVVRTDVLYRPMISGGEQQQQEDDDNDNVDASKKEDEAME